MQAGRGEQGDWRGIWVERGGVAHSVARWLLFVAFRAIRDALAWVGWNCRIPNKKTGL